MVPVGVALSAYAVACEAPKASLSTAAARPPSSGPLDPKEFTSFQLVEKIPKSHNSDILRFRLPVRWR